MEHLKHLKQGRPLMFDIYCLEEHLHFVGPMELQHVHEIESMYYQVGLKDKKALALVETR